MGAVLQFRLRCAGVRSSRYQLSAGGFGQSFRKRKNDAVHSAVRSPINHGENVELGSHQQRQDFSAAKRCGHGGGLYGHRLRLYCSVRPGITGLTQLVGRDDSSYHRRVATDSVYAEKKSLMFDLKLLLLAIPTLMS